MGYKEIIILLLFAVLAAIFFGVYRFSKRPATSNNDTAGPAGVGGWLLFLVVGFMFLGPLFGAGRMSNDFSSTESQYPGLLTLAEWSTFKYATWISFLVVCCLSFYAGLGLAKGQNMSVVNRAKILLWVIGPLATIFMGLIIPFAIFGEAEPDAAFFGSIFSSVISATIWTAYLTKSRRVKATYAPVQHVESA